jgi:predicted RNase H-like HicB family nuclease
MAARLAIEWLLNAVLAMPTIVNRGPPMIRYIALIDGESGAYGAAVLDLSGIAGAGKTVEDAITSVIAGACLWAAAAREEGKETPRARTRRVLSSLHSA